MTVLALLGRKCVQTYASCVACCPLVSHVEYVLSALLMLKMMGQTDRWTDGMTQDRCIMLTIRCGQ